MTLLVSERSLMIRSKFRSVLQLRLQHRRTREQLAEQGIMPPLKGPSAFFEQRRNLERAKTEDFLKHKIGGRPDRSELVKMNILEDAVPNPTQMKQKKARLADNLNEKILHRPGPLELVEKNILPLNSTVKHAMKVGQIQLPQAAETSPFEDDGSSSNSGSRPSPGMLGAPQQQAARTALGPCTPLACSLGLKHRRDFSTSVPEPVGETKIVASNGQLVPILPVPTVPTGLQRVSDGAKPQRQKKAKDPKPKVKKLKYHQYIPPDQKAEKSPIAMDAAYSRLLQQQQIFLQLQILNQQQQSFSFQTIQPGTPGLAPDQIIRFASAVPTPVPCVPLSPITKSSHRAAITTSAKPELLPANLDDLTVSELRQQLRKRGLPVSGTKPTLLERLKPYQICSPKPAPPPMAGGPAFEPPAGGLSREGLRLSPPAAGPTGPAGKPQPGSSLVEKEKVIERLTWKLQHEQRQAEDLRLELELRKQRHRQAPGPLGARPFPGPAFPGPGQASETSRPGSPVGPGYGRGLAQASPATAVAREAEARGGAPSPANPFFFPPAATRPEEAVDGGSPCPQQQPRSRSPSRGHSGDGGLSDILVPRQIQPEFPYSPASLHSFFTLDDADIETKNESGSEENFESEVYLSASLGSEARDYSSLEALASSDSGGFPSLEEELTEAIKSAELSQSQSIEDILEGHLMSSDASPSLDRGLPESPPASLSSSPPSPDYLSEGERSTPRRAGRLSPAELLPALPPYDVFGACDGLAGPFSPAGAGPPCPSPERRGPAKAELADLAFDPADWIDPPAGNPGPGCGNGYGSVFSTDFLDAPDLNINRMIDLLVEQW